MNSFCLPCARLRRHAMLVFACGLFGAAVSAQTMYRCGNTFSQVPCGNDAQAVRAQGVPQPVVPPPMRKLTPEQEARLVIRCHQALRDIPAWKDRESLRISPPERGQAATVRLIDGVRRPVVPYYSQINARNSYGAYTGEKLASCYFDMDEEKLLDIYTGS